MRVKPASTPAIQSVIEVACLAADYVVEVQRAGLLNVKSKSLHTDLVTEADVASEHLLRQRLDDLDPGIGFWGEESNQRPDCDRYWIVDPIDGTVNFAHGLTYWAVNVALVQEGQTVLGVTVQMPYRRIYRAVLGGGAWMDDPIGGDRRLRVSTVTELRSAFLASGFPYHSAENGDNNDAEFAWFSSRCLGMRVLGAGALDIAQVAAGMLSGFWEGWLSPWDAAAGALMVREAGGVVTDYAGREWDFDGPGLVASNGAIHDAQLEGSRIARAGRQENLLGL
jgi:myo-inositol-1(or 4)-monophosphatase